MDARLTDKVTIVTGGSRGIGRAIVHVLAGAGMEVIFTYRDQTAAAEVVSSAGDVRVTGEPMDVRDAAACAALAEKVFDRTGRIDLLVNNAGVIRDNPLGALEPEDVQMCWRPTWKALST